MSQYIVRGVLIGGSIGILAYVFGVTDTIGRSFMLGFIGGTLAGVTMALIRRNKPPLD